MNALSNLMSPQLDKIHSGKVRESFRVDDNTRMIVATDRVSSFDQVLKTPIPGKGAVLNQLAAFWFKNTRDIVDNHFIKIIDPNISLVREAVPVKIEVIVRGYLTGSMWRKYQKGVREFSGVKAPDGLKKHDKFPEPLVTPTTKEESDREISPKNIVEEGWAEKEVYDEMERISKKLFKRGQDYLAERNLILVDTKYEFGIIDGKIVLIDEIHTPDSSRFWQADNYEKDPANVIQLDKEFVRSYLLKNKVNDAYPDTLPEDVVNETIERYQALYKMITGEDMGYEKVDVNTRITSNLSREKLMKDAYVAIIMGSSADMEHCRKMKEVIEKYDIHVDLRVMSAHKNGEDIAGKVNVYHHSIEPGAIIAVAGLSNGLGGALGANLSVPVINCPPFKDNVDMMVNINSSLMMPSKTPAATVVKPANAVAFALRALNLNRLRHTFGIEIEAMKKQLREDDENVSQG